MNPFNPQSNPRAQLRSQPNQRIDWTRPYRVPRPRRARFRWLRWTLQTLLFVALLVASIYALGWALSVAPTMQ